MNLQVEQEPYKSGNVLDITAAKPVVANLNPIVIFTAGDLSNLT